ncbi:unnamed protein product [Orchesella dallaii]|uniref:Uncharacterized protein n=1 Tax=Orchesella dallaii TaxID=48710 RepID=A0ABP1PTY2_9HEXA
MLKPSREWLVQADFSFATLLGTLTWIYLLHYSEDEYNTMTTYPTVWTTLAISGIIRHRDGPLKREAWENFYEDVLPSRSRDEFTY